MVQLFVNLHVYHTAKEDVAYIRLHYVALALGCMLSNFCP